MTTTVRMLLAAAVLMLLAGVIFALLRLWIYAALLGAGALGCAAAAMNHRGRRETGTARK